MKTRYLRLIKKQRGFTLIELLAVILILGIIALIAIPTVSSVVEQSRRGAAESSASQFVTSVGELVMAEELTGNALIDGVYTSESLINRGINIKGTLPDVGMVQIENGEVVACNLTYGNYNVTCNGSEFNTINKDDMAKFTMIEDNDSNNEVSVGDKICIDTECFYVININGDNVRMLTEWNLNVGYNTDSVRIDILSSNRDYIYKHQSKSYLRDAYTYTKNDVISSNIKQNSNYNGCKNDNVSNTTKCTGLINFYNLDSSMYNDNYTNNQYNGYWVDKSGNILPSYGTSFPAYVYDKNSNLYKYINSYVDNLIVLSGENSISGNLIEYSETVLLGCSNIYAGDTSYSCSGAPEWFRNSTFWTGTASLKGMIWGVFKSDSAFISSVRGDTAGLRPVITISKDLIK